MIRCIIIEDENLARSLIRDYLKDVPFMELLGDYSHPLRALEVLQSGDVDLIFLDIEMPKLSGIDLLEQLPNAPHVIFTTAYAEHALKGYDYKTVDYLVKPIAFCRFLKACLKAQKMMKTEKVSEKPKLRYVNLPNGSKVIKLKFDETLYVVSDGDYLTIHTQNGKFEIRMSMRKLLTYELPLVRVHKSYAVNPSGIQEVGNRSLIIEGLEIPVGRSFNSVVKALKE